MLESLSNVRQLATRAFTLLGVVGLCSLVGVVAGVTPVHAAEGGAANGEPTPAATTVAPGPVAPVAPPAAAPTAAPAPPTDPHHSLAGARIELSSGSPFASARHIEQADFARSGRSFLPSANHQPTAGLAPGTIGILVRDEGGNPVPNHELRLKVVQESIEHGNRDSELTTRSNDQGYAGFFGQKTESSFNYEVFTHRDGARYSSGSFRLNVQQGELITLYLYPTTDDISKTFVFSRGLYVVAPREDVFQIQVLFRFHNTNPVSWVPKAFVIPLPTGASAFRPASTTGDLRVIEERGAVRITGTFTPGEHELSFAYQLSNDRKTSVQLPVPVPPQMTDAKLVVESSRSMSIRALGFEPAQETRGRDGQRALVISKDFLRTPGERPEQVILSIDGLPTRGYGAIIASIIAGLIASAGLVFAFGKRKRPAVAETDRQQARELLLQELVELERAFRSEQIGPKTYQQARATLLDALARLDA